MVFRKYPNDFAFRVLLLRMSVEENEYKGVNEKNALE